MSELQKFFGQWKLEKSSSNSIDDMLAFFGVPLVARLAIKTMSLTMIISSGPEGGLHIIDKTGNQEISGDLYLDGKPRIVDGKSVTLSVYSEGVIVSLTKTDDKFEVKRTISVEGSVLRNKYEYKLVSENQYKTVQQIFNKV